MSDQTPEISLTGYAAERETDVAIDVREGAEYAQAHVPGAVLVPMGQLASRLTESSEPHGFSHLRMGQPLQSYD